jgi:hypothetical protein
MGTESNFKDLIKKFFVKVAKKAYEKINGSKDEPNYLHDKMLNPEYSVDMTYSSVSGNYTRVTADVVAFDSPVPLKSRGSIKSATGDIPKIGLGFTLNEKQMNTLRILKSMNGRATELAKKVFEDTNSCIYGIKELIEEALLIGFSSGITIIPDEENVGTGIRINYNIPESNQFGAEFKWDHEDAKPIDDIKRVLKKAKEEGEYPDTIWMDSEGVDKLAVNSQIKEMYAFGLNFTGSNIPAPNEEQLTNFLKKSVKLNLVVIDRSFVHEKDGKKTVTQGWTPNMVVFTTGQVVGSLVYSTLAEEEFPQEGVAYAKPNEYILIAKKGTTNPVSENTTGQALAIPVLQNVESIFYLDTSEALEVDSGEVEEDADITLWESTLTKATVIEKLNEMGITTTSTITDAGLIAKINKLSDEEENILKDLLGL